MSVDINDSLRLDKLNTPTREGERVEKLSDIQNIPTPSVGMGVFVEEEGREFVITALKDKVVAGTTLKNAAVESYEMRALKSDIQGTSENSNPVTDPFKFLGEFDSYDKLNETLDTLTYSLGHQQGYGYFRARVGTLAIDIKSILVSSAQNAVGQVVQGMLTLNSNKKLTLANGTYKIYFRKHQNNAWGDWKDITAASSGGGNSSGNGDLDLSEYVQKTDENVQHIVGGLIIGSTNTPSAMQSGKHKGRIMLTGVENPLVGVQAGTIPYYVQAHENNMYIGPARPNATSVDKDGKVTMPATLSVTGDISEGGKTLSKKYTTKDELTTTENYFVDYVKDQVKDRVKAIIVNGGDPIPPDSNGIVNLGVLGGGSTGDGGNITGPVLGVTVDGDNVVVNSVAQIPAASTKNKGVVQLSNDYSTSDDEKVVTQKALNNAYTELAANKQDKIENLSDYVTKDMMPEYEGDGIYFNDGDGGTDAGFSIHCGNGLSINETTKALQVNIGKGLAFDEETNAITATGSGDVDLSDYVTKDMMPEYEGDGIYFNDGDGGTDAGFSIHCGNGLSINETTKALQVNIGKGLAFDEETNAITATGSGDVDLSDYVTRADFDASEAETYSGFTNVANRISDLKYSDLNDLPTFKTINDKSIFVDENGESLQCVEKVLIDGDMHVHPDENGVLDLKGVFGNVKDSDLLNYVTNKDFKDSEDNILRRFEDVEESIPQIKIGNDSIANESNIVNLEDHFKTINGESILGKGDLIISGGDGTIDLSEYVTRTDFDALSTETYDGFTNVANRISDLKYSDLNDLPTFKTINGNSILGSGEVDLSDYVTKVEGKQLSTNDFTDADKSKLADIEDNANNYEHPKEGPNASITIASINPTKLIDENIDKITIPSITVNTYGHVTSASSKEVEINLPDFSKFAKSIQRDDLIAGVIDGVVDISDFFNNTQTKLVSGTNIKTINNQSILGSGNIIANAYPLANHGTSDTTFTLTPNVFHVWDNVESLTLTFETAVSGVTNEYLFQFSCLDGQVTTLGLPEGIMWANGEVPTLEVLKTYQVSILNNCATIQSFG